MECYAIGRIKKDFLNSRVNIARIHLIARYRMKRKEIHEPIEWPNESED
ncbi:MAG: hypothetical protein IH964_11290 [Candidatus Dadabacteria bacterium]|nr:hypothetical protein [Candidatus Dadabacteria bacterium]